MASTSTLLTRRQVGALLGVAEAEVKARDNVAFHPTKGPDGSWRYQPDEVAAVLRGVAGGEPGVEPNGAVCAAAFESFRDGKSLTEAVIALRQSPVVIRTLRAEYDRMASHLTICPDSLEQLAVLLRARPRDHAHLLGLVAQLHDRAQHEYQRGYEDGLAEAGDLGEIVDPSTGQTRPLKREDIESIASGLPQCSQHGSKSST
jgi:hypothetical protein